MPSWTSFSRCFRRKVIVGLILALLLTYFVLNLFRNEKKRLNLRSDFEEIDNRVIGDLNNEDGEEDAAKLFGRPILWQMEIMNEVGNVNSVELESVDGLNDNETFSKPCRNSVQGRSLIVDDKGYVCARHDVLANGCCNTEISGQTQTSVPYTNKSRYTCETCNAQGCCAIYEYCVSCCLDSKKIKKNSKVGNKENKKLNKSEDISKLRLHRLDRFQLCLAACRTSSASVQHENTYKNPHAKHCFLLQLPNSRLIQRHKRNSISMNNNQNDPRIAFTSFSVVKFTFTYPHLKSSHNLNDKFTCGIFSKYSI